MAFRRVAPRLCRRFSQTLESARIEFIGTPTDRPGIRLSLTSTGGKRPASMD